MCNIIDNHNAALEMLEDLDDNGLPFNTALIRSAEKHEVMPTDLSALYHYKTTAEAIRKRIRGI